MTMCTFRRRQYFADSKISESVPSYADSRNWASTFRRISGFCVRKARDERLWQDGYYDRVHRAEDATLDVVSYIVLNPVRAGLCSDPATYPFLGSSRYELSRLVTATEWRPPPLG